MKKRPSKLWDNMDFLDIGPLQQSLAMKMAEITMNLSKVEWLLGEWIFRIIGTDPADGHLLIAKDSIAIRIQHLCWLSKKYEGEVAKLLQDITKLVKALQDQRNAHCHGIYLGREKEGDKLYFWMPGVQGDAADGASVMLMMHFTEEDLDVNHRASFNLVRRLEDFVHKNDIVSTIIARGCES